MFGWRSWGGEENAVQDEEEGQDVFDVLDIENRAVAAGLDFGVAIGAVRSREERPLHSFEVDLRSTPHAKGVQKTKLKEPVEQGLLSTIKVFVYSRSHENNELRI